MNNKTIEFSDKQIDIFKNSYTNNLIDIGEILLDYSIILKTSTDELIKIVNKISLSESKMDLRLVLKSIKDMSMLGLNASSAGKRLSEVFQGFK